MVLQYNNTDESLGSKVSDLTILTPANKTLVLQQPVWDDLRVPISAIRVGSAFPPDFSAWLGNLMLYWFDPTSAEQVYFVAQLPHKYKSETDLHPHVHWVPKSTGGAGEVVSWGLEYTWASIGQTFPSPTTIYGNTHTPADDPVVQDRQYLTELTAISGTGKTTVSSMLVCRRFRDATGAGATDDYTDDAGLLEFDFHFQIDTQGSRQEYVK